MAASLRAAAASIFVVLSTSFTQALALVEKSTDSLLSPNIAGENLPPTFMKMMESPLRLHDTICDTRNWQAGGYWQGYKAIPDFIQTLSIECCHPSATAMPEFEVACTSKLIDAEVQPLMLQCSPPCFFLPSFFHHTHPTARSLARFKSGNTNGLQSASGPACRIIT